MNDDESKSFADRIRESVEDMQNPFEFESRDTDTLGSFGGGAIVTDTIYLDYGRYDGIEIDHDGETYCVEATDDGLTLEKQ